MCVVYGVRHLDIKYWPFQLLTWICLFNATGFRVLTWGNGAKKVVPRPIEMFGVISELIEGKGVEQLLVCSKHSQC